MSLYFDKETIQEHIDKDRFLTYRKKLLTKALRVKGSFTVMTKEGKLHCDNGYLAIDSQGYPYPIDFKIFEETYERADE